MAAYNIDLTNVQIAGDALPLARTLTLPVVLCQVVAPQA
jgi:hypothetical protein